MLPNEIFALKCRERYAEDGLIVDQSNGEFAHCPLPKGLGDSGYYLLHDDHQWQGLLQSKDVGRRCYFIANAQRWLLKAPFVDGYFELWAIYDEFNKPTEEHRRKNGEAHKGDKNPNFGKTHSEETKRKNSEAHKGENHNMFGKTHSEETKRKMSNSRKGVKRGPYKKRQSG